MARGIRFLGGFLGLAAISLCFAASAVAKPGAQNPVPGAERWVAAKLAKKNLTPSSIECHYSGNRTTVCRFDAKTVIQEWPYDCRGHARRGPRGSRFGRCRLTGPPLAPLRSSEAVGIYHPWFGINEDWTTQYVRVDLARGLGSNTARVPFNWDVIEARRGSYDWSAYDRVYAAMRSQNLLPILVVNGAPCWARPGTPCQTADRYPPDKRYLQQWSAWIKAAIQRYPQLAGIEVWNEPNLNGYWAPKPNPKRYAKLLKASYKAVKFVNRSLPVVFGGLVPQFGPAPRGMDSRIFQRRAYKAGAGRYLDAFGVHPYVFPSNDPYLIQSVRAQIAVPKGIAARFGHPRTPLWVTEFGLSTVGEGALSSPDQADKLVALYQLMRRIPGVPVVILHRLIDLNPDDHDWQAGMGLASPGGTLKPAYCALAFTRTGSCRYR